MEDNTRAENSNHGEDYRDASAAVLTGAELSEAREYGRYELYCLLADKALDLLVYGLAALFIAMPLDGWLRCASLLARFASLRLVAVFLILTLVHIVVSFPLSLYSGFWLEHYYKLSKLSFAAWLRRYAIRMALAVGVGAVMWLGLFWLIWTVHSWWWLAAAGTFFVVMIIFGQIFPVLILPLFYKIERFESPSLTDRFARLTTGTGLKIEGVYRMVMSEETVKANAMLAGLGNTRRVILGDTLLDEFGDDEIEVVFAHEVGHHICQHVRQMIVVGLLMSILGFWICDRALFLSHTGGMDYATLPVYELPTLIFILTLFSMVLEPLMNAISRRNERQADRYAIERTGNPAACASAFRKLARQNKANPSPHWLEELLFHSHPSIGQRVAMAEKLLPG
jgi:STE24 endopeptidase